MSQAATCIVAAQDQMNETAIYIPGLRGTFQPTTVAVFGACGVVGQAGAPTSVTFPKVPFMTFRME